MCTKFKSCHFSITDIVDVDENIEVMLFCSYHDCLPEDVPEECTVEDELDQLNAFLGHDDSYEPPAEVYEDKVPF